MAVGFSAKAGAFRHAPANMKPQARKKGGGMRAAGGGMWCRTQTRCGRQVNPVNLQRAAQAQAQRRVRPRVLPMSSAPGWLRRCWRPCCRPARVGGGSSVRRERVVRGVVPCAQMRLRAARTTTEGRDNGEKAGPACYRASTRQARGPRHTQCVAPYGGSGSVGQCANV